MNIKGSFMFILERSLSLVNTLSMQSKHLRIKFGSIASFSSLFPVNLNIRLSLSYMRLIMRTCFRTEEADMVLKNENKAYFAGEVSFSNNLDSKINHLNIRHQHWTTLFVFLVESKRDKWGKK